MDKIKILSNNTLKIIACISMVFDHIGLLFLNNLWWFRAIGRLAYPLFAFCIAEGCFYTKDKIKHLSIISILGILMWIIEYTFAKIADFPIFITFAISIILIYLIDDIDKVVKEKKKSLIVILVSIFIIITVGLAIFIHYFPYFNSNYGFYGIMTPVLLYVIKKYLNNYKICIFMQILVLALLFVARAIATHQILVLFSFASLVLLLMYNNQRGKWNMKYFFYLFYPFHLVVLYGILLLIS